MRMELWFIQAHFNSLRALSFVFLLSNEDFPSMWMFCFSIDWSKFDWKSEVCFTPKSKSEPSSSCAENTNGCLDCSCHCCSSRDLANTEWNRYPVSKARNERDSVALMWRSSVGWNVTGTCRVQSCRLEGAKAQTRNMGSCAFNEQKTTSHFNSILLTGFLSKYFCATC